MIRRPPRSTRTDPLFPYTTLFRSLTVRFGLSSIDRLDADIALSREAAGIRARGRVRAAVSQICVVSGEPVPVALDEPVDVLFTPQAGSPGADDEFEISSAECDVLPLEGEAIDLGELAAETMTLALDPYPRLRSEERRVGKECVSTC